MDLFSYLMWFLSFLLYLWWCKTGEYSYLFCTHVSTSLKNIYTQPILFQTLNNDLKEPLELIELRQTKEEMRKNHLDELKSIIEFRSFGVFISNEETQNIMNDFHILQKNKLIKGILAPKIENESLDYFVSSHDKKKMIQKVGIELILEGLGIDSVISRKQVCTGHLSNMLGKREKIKRKVETDQPIILYIENFDLIYKNLKHVYSFATSLAQDSTFSGSYCVILKIRDREIAHKVRWWNGGAKFDFLQRKQYDLPLYPPFHHDIVHWPSY